MAARANDGADGDEEDGNSVVKAGRDRPALRGILKLGLSMAVAVIRPPFPLAMAGRLVGRVGCDAELFEIGSCARTIDRIQPAPPPNFPPPP